MRIVFMATGEIALPSLSWLLGPEPAALGHELVAVYTQPDKPVGRKQILTAPAIKVAALAAGIPVFQPESLRHDPAALATLSALRSDLIIVMAYGQILPKAVIAAPTRACVNLHASLLPRHRGAAPIQAAIREGDVHSGISLMMVAPRLDSGDVILQERFALSPDETGGQLHDRLAELGPVVLAKGLPLLGAGAIPATPQEESLVTYAAKLEREHGRLDWTRTAPEIDRWVRAYDPWPGTFTTLTQDGETRHVKVFPPLLPGPDLSLPPGTIRIADRRIHIACGEGSIELCGDLQLEGRRRLPASEWLRGVDLPVGTILGEAASSEE
jgi:methionyl-tRNA formyltransferase